MRCSPNVISLYTGAPLGEVPEYSYRRGRKVTFRAPLKTNGTMVDAVGEQTVFGFILHHTIGLKKEDYRRHTIWDKWSISEPITGARVTHGASRVDALFNLAWLVALHGGVERFEEVVRLSIEKANKQRVPAAMAATPKIGLSGKERIDGT